MVTSGGQEYEAFQIVAGADGDFRIGAKALGTSPFVRGLRRAWDGGSSFSTYAPAGMPEFGSLASGRGPLGLKVQTQYMTGYNPTTGVAVMAPFIAYGGFSPTYISSPNGPVVALPNAISVDANGRSYSLFEVRPTTGPNQVIFLTYEPGVINYKVTYTLKPDEHVISVTPNPQGGIIFLTRFGTGTLSYLNFIGAAGNWIKGIPAAHATHAVYMPVGAGMVGLIDPRPSGIGFLRGPLFGTPSEYGSTYTPWGSEPMDITCGSATSDGTCWWGGSTKRDNVETNTILIGARFFPNLQIIRLQELTSAPWDQTMRSIVATPNGYGAWAADGQCGFFDQGTGETYARYPATPTYGLEFRSVVASPGIKGDGPVNPFCVAYSNFGIVGYDTVNQRSILVKAGLTDQVRTASTPSPVVVGGLSPTIYAQLFQSADREQELWATSTQSEVTLPPLITVPANEHIAVFKVQTKGVSFERLVEVLVHPGGKLVKFRLLPPTPQSISPASQTVTGGETAYALLSLNAKAPADSLFVTMSSNGPEVKVDPVFAVTAGLYSKSFSIRTTPVTTSVTRTITATYNHVSRQATVTVVP